MSDEKQPTADEEKAAAEKAVEQAASAELSSTWTNRFYVHVGPSLTRIAFAEQAYPGMPSKYHTSVVMSSSDAILLARLITKFDGELKSLTAATAPTPADAPDRV